jgi:hypothetical protein
MDLKIKIVGDLTLPSIQAAIKTINDNLMKEVRTEVANRTPYKEGRARRGWQERRNTVSNEVPYIERLEKGYSRQAPNGFVKQGVSAAVSNISKRINK